MNTKKAFHLLLVTICFSHCAQSQTNNNSNKLEKNSVMKEYYIVFKYSMPFEVQINGMVAEKETESGLSGAVNLNQFILKDGVQHLKIKISHPFIKKGGTIKSAELKSLKARIYIATKNESGKTKLLKSILFPEIKKPVPYIEHQWKFKATLPFTLEGWKNGEDLSTWDEETLEKRVVTKFKELRNILNNGGGTTFLKEIEKCNQEFFKANYLTDNEIQEYKNNLKSTYENHKGIMPPIKNYRMRIMGGGKVVALETLGKYKGQGILTAENKKDSILYKNYVMLYKPKNKDEFEVVRINTSFSSI